MGNLGAVLIVLVLIGAVLLAVGAVPFTPLVLALLIGTTAATRFIQ